MKNNEAQAETFVEKVLALLEDRFPWLGKDEPASGAETVDRLSNLYDTLQKARSRGKKRVKTARN